MNLITIAFTAQSFVSRIIKKEVSTSTSTIDPDIKATVSPAIKNLRQSNREEQYLVESQDCYLNEGEKESYLRRYQLVKHLKHLLNEGYTLTDVLECCADIAIELDLHATCACLEEASEYSEKNI